MTDIATVADKFKLAFYEAAVDIMAAEEGTASVFVTYGAPASLAPDDIVSFLGVTSEQSTVAIGNRSREEVLTLDVAISCFRGGNGEAELIAAARAYELLRKIEYYVRKTDTTLGGVVRHCFLSGHESSGQTDPQFIKDGRVIEITATFRAVARIT